MLRRGFKAIHDIVGDPIASPTRAQLDAITCATPSPHKA